LRAAETALLAQSGQAAATDKVLYTTINRDTAAINARNYAAAEKQASHFRALPAQFKAILSAQAKAGARVAALLREAHAPGIATQAQSANAIKSVQRELSKSGVATARIRRIAGSTLTPKTTNLLEVLGQG
jgi:phosphohistidine phosphatase SixA